MDLTNNVSLVLYDLIFGLSLKSIILFDILNLDNFLPYVVSISIIGLVSSYMLIINCNSLIF